MQLGDAVQMALRTVGITEDRVSALLGKDCGCGRRKEQLNALDTWARRVLAGKTEHAARYLFGLFSADGEGPGS